MMTPPLSDDDHLPRKSYALIRLLDESTDKPSLPQTAQGAINFEERRPGMYFLAGKRALVDTLVAQMNQEILEHEQGEAGGENHSPPTQFPRVLGEGISVREIASSGDVVPTSD